jgi:hypothetical protein
MNRVSAIAACFTALGVLAASLQPAWPTPKDQSRIGKGNYGSVPDPGPRGEKSDFEGIGDGKADVEKAGPDLTMPSDRLGGYATQDIETEELSVDAAKRALDAFAEVRDKYTGEGLEDYISLEAFVSETEAGKRLEADIMAHGFSDITDWNETITAVGSAYSAIIYDYASDLRQQIEAVRNDPKLDEAMRARLVAGLTALMPPQTNRTVLQALLDDPIYRNKLRLLQEEE